MAFHDDAQALALTLQSLYGDLADQPLFAPAKPTANKLTAAPVSASTALAAYAEEIRYCQRCVLHIGRRNLVFGRGQPEAEIAFIGDFPSPRDDAEGLPFTDEAGDLLHKMIVAMKLRPEETYLANIFKCRPPSGERVDQDLFRHCEEHLHRQFSFLSATHIVAMGDHAARALANSESPLPVLRRQIYDWHGRKVICTHHPRDLLNNPTKKKEAWEDLQMAMRSMGIK